MLDLTDHVFGEIHFLITHLEQTFSLYQFFLLSLKKNGKMYCKDQIHIHYDLNFQNASSIEHTRF